MTRKKQVHLKIANEVWPNGGRLMCPECLDEQTFTTEEAAEYFESQAWPVCCGETMLLGDAKKKKGRANDGH